MNANGLTWKTKASIFGPEYVLKCVQSYVHLTVRQRETSFSSCGGFRGPDLRPCLPHALSFRSACGQSLLLGLFRAHTGLG